MYFKDFEQLFTELEKMPTEGDIIKEDGIYWLKQSYAINRMNEIFGEGNWAIENIRKQELENGNKESFGKICILTIGYKHPVSNEWLKTDGISGTGGELDNNIIGRAFLNAISSLGDTFGRFLLTQFE